MAHEGNSTAERALDPSVEAAVDIVIVNWNSGAHLRECLAALDGSPGAQRLNLIVVDNASTDQSAAGLAVDHAKLELLQNPVNRGFAVASNQGARIGSAGYLLFLNPDVRMAAGAVESAVAYLDHPSRANVGIVGAQLLDQEGRIQRCCARTPTVNGLLLHRLFLDRFWPGLVPPHFLSDWDHQETREVDQVIGASLLIRRGLFERLGGFDERFFLYYEDVDLCLRVRRAGSQVMYFVGAKGHHAGGGSTNAVIGRRLYHLSISRADYTAKWHGRLAAWGVIMLTLGAELPIRWLRAILTRSPHEGQSVRQAMVLVCKDLGNRTCRMGGCA